MNLGSRDRLRLTTESYNLLNRDHQMFVVNSNGFQSSMKVH
jgi:hypothetical protein